MVRACARVVAAMMVGGGLVATVVVVPAAHAADLPAPSTQPFELVADFRCEEMPGAVSGRVHTVGTAPVSVDAGGEMRLTGTVTATVEGDLAGATLNIHYVTSASSGAGYVYASPPPPLDISLGVGRPGTVTVHQDVVLSARMPDGVEREVGTCTTTPVGPLLSVDVEVPGGGSLQLFELGATASCTSDTGGQAESAFFLAGLAPARLTPGEAGVLTGDMYSGLTWSGIPSREGDDVTLVVTVGAERREVQFQAMNGARGLRITLPVLPVAPGDTVEVRFGRVTSVIPQRFGASTVTCVFPATGTPLRIPVTSTAPTTTTTAPPADPRCAHRSQLPAWIWRVLSRWLGIRC